MILKKWSAVLLFTVASLSSFSSVADACTSVLVGKGATADGSVLVSRTEDSSGEWAKHITVVPRTSYKAGDVLKEYNGLEIPQPKVGYKYTAIPDWDSSEGRFEEAGINEYQVAVSATESVESSEAAQKADPFIEKGIGEFVIPTLLLPRATTARQGVELMGEFIEKYGAAEPFGMSIADPTEVWYLEVGSGHKWVAVRVPDNSYMVVANELRIEQVNLQDTKNYLGSKDLLTFAEQNGLYNPKEGPFVFRKAFGLPDQPSVYNYRRVWWGQATFTPSMKQDAEKKEYPVFMTPDKKIAPTDVMGFFRSHYEGTPYDPMTGVKERSVNVDQTMESHILQLRSWLPNPVGGVAWISLATPETSTYVPYYSGITGTPEAYRTATDQYDSKSAYWAFRSVNNLVRTNRGSYLPVVLDTWKTFETGIFAKQASIENQAVNYYKQNASKGEKFLTTYTNDLAMSAMQIARELESKIMTELAKKKTSNHDSNL